MINIPDSFDFDNDLTKIIYAYLGYMIFFWLYSFITGPTWSITFLVIHAALLYLLIRKSSQFAIALLFYIIGIVLINVWAIATTITSVGSKNDLGLLFPKLFMLFIAYALFRILKYLRNDNKE